MAGVSAIKAGQEKRRPGAGCGNVLSMVPGTGELLGAVGRGRVVISQALRRVRGPSGARGDSPSERIAFALLQEPPVLGHKEGEKGNYGILYRAGQRRRIFSKETGEREISVFQRRRGKREERILGRFRRGTERDASVWVAKRDRRLWSYCDPVSPLRHQKFTSVPHTQTELSYTTTFPVHCNQRQYVVFSHFYHFPSQFPSYEIIHNNVFFH